MTLSSHNCVIGHTRKRERGFTILETMFAMFVLLVGITGLMTLMFAAAIQNTNNGDQATRATEYAQDKMEQLLALSYTDVIDQVAGFPTQAGACTSGCGLTAGGSLTSPTTNYFDYIDTTGAVVTAVTAPNAIAYTRYWIIDTSSTSSSVPANVKRISVRVVANLALAPNKASVNVFAPSTTLVSYKSNAQFP